MSATKERQEFVNIVWDKTVKCINEYPDMKDWFDRLSIEDKAKLEGFTKCIIKTTMYPDLIPIDIENAPKADIKYFDCK